MDRGPAEVAISRIEAALARIEDAAARRRRPDSALHDRHERLRSAVTASLRQLDDLLASQPK